MKRIEFMDLTESEINNEGIDGREWDTEWTEEEDKEMAIQCIYEEVAALERTDEYGADFCYEMDGAKRFVFVK